MKQLISTFFALTILVLQPCVADEKLSLENISGEYQTTNAVKGVDTTERASLLCTALDKGDDPIFSRVRISFTAFWVGHKNPVRLEGCGIGNLDQDGVFHFQFIDEDGRHGSGTFTRNGDQFFLTLKTSDHVKEDNRDADKMAQVYNRVMVFERK
ncbi:hypothetical protein [Oceaniferula spumae]